jgi:hypothetical protein
MGTPRKNLAQTIAQKLAHFSPAPHASKVLQQTLLQSVN